MIVSLIWILVIFIYLFYHFYFKRRHLPPGPIPLPLIGNIFQIGLNPPGYAALINWRKRYGNVYTYWLGEIPFVTVNDCNLLHETFVKDGDAYSDRFTFGEFAQTFYGGDFHGSNLNGHYWREQRRFNLRVFRDFGVGKNVMQEKILEEVEYMLANICAATNDNNNTSPSRVDVDICDYFDICIGSIINNMLFGYRFDESKLDEFRHLKGLIDDHSRSLMGDPLLFITMLYPAMIRVPIVNRSHKQFMHKRDQLFDFISRQIDVHEKCFCADDEPTNYVFAFLREMRRLQENNDSTANDNSFSRQQLVSVCHDLWVAGLHTTAATLSWAILYLLHNDDVQHKVHAELDEHIPNGRLIDMTDRQKLPYMCAVINETQRLANILTLNLPHKTTRDVTIDGYAIRKGTVIVPQISVVHLDPNIFVDPEQFNPDRHLDANGHLRQIDALMPFSIGKRQCLGEGLAKMELFLVLANLLNKFQIVNSPDRPLPSIRKRFSIVIQPRPFKCCFKLRS